MSTSDDNYLENTPYLNCDIFLSSYLIIITVDYYLLQPSLICSPFA